LNPGRDVRAATVGIVGDRRDARIAVDQPIGS
jgi:hypothetical protein